MLLVDVDEAGLGETAALIADDGGDTFSFTADVSDAASVASYVAAAVSRFGRIDAFFNNAGVNASSFDIADYPEDLFDRVISINVRGVFLGMKYVLRQMLEQGSGAVVNTASVLAVGGLGGQLAYVASKHAVLGMTRTAALEVAPHGVRVNAVIPGNIKTQMAMRLEPGQTEAQKEAMHAAIVPQRRMGLPSEIANAVVFLVSDDSQHVTGIDLAVDGGITAQVYPIGFGAQP